MDDATSWTRLSRLLDEALDVAPMERDAWLALQELHVADLVAHASARIRSELFSVIREHLRCHQSAQRGSILTAVGGLHVAERALKRVVIFRLDLDRLTATARAKSQTVEE